MISENEHFNELKKLTSEHKLIPFLGAGFSKNLGYPLWRQFVSEYLQTEIKGSRYHLDLNNFNNIPEATEYYLWCVYELEKDHKSEFETPFDFGKRKFKEKLIECLSTYDELAKQKLNDNKPEGDLHKKVLKKYNVIYTTNWDRALELTADSLSFSYKGQYLVGVNTIHYSGDKTSDNNKLFIKFHGHYKASEKSIVACRTDYYKRISVCHKNGLDETFRKHIVQNSFLFLGYNFQDPNVKYILDQIKTTFDVSYLRDIRPKLYWVVFREPPEAMAKYLKEWYGVIPVSINTNEEEEQEYTEAFRQCNECVKDKTYLNSCSECSNWKSCEFIKTLGGIEQKCFRSKLKILLDNI